MGKPKLPVTVEFFLIAAGSVGMLSFLGTTSAMAAGDYSQEIVELAKERVELAKDPGAYGNGVPILDKLDTNPQLIVVATIVIAGVVFLTFESLRRGSGISSMITTR
jgi:hypothetical protein